MRETPALAGFSVADLARRWRIGPDKIRAFIRRGDLVAVNMAICLAGRPQWRVTPQEVERFEARRASTPASKTMPRRRRLEGVIDYYPD
jgi:hypothetical protein